MYLFIVFIIVTVLCFRDKISVFKTYEYAGYVFEM